MTTNQNQLPRVFQLLPTTCNEPEGKKRNEEQYEEMLEVAMIRKNQYGGPWGNEGSRDRSVEAQK